ncbi:MAG: hypothetical protein ACTSRY_02735 [Alphaproteobacteria bacterium]
MRWRQALIASLGILFGVGGALYAAILIVDPYDTVWFSPPLARAPISTNQRFSFPALARKARFDSAIVGTSTTRMLEPARLDRLFGARFVNLSMNSGTAYEQMRLFELFARHHPRARTVIFGIDATFCQVGGTVERFTPRPFPAWMYDENRWNDLAYLFNFPTIEEAGKAFAYLVGWRPLKYGMDGYTDFLPSPAAYDLAKARRNIYGSETPRRRPPVRPAAAPGAAARAAWNFPALPYLARMLERTPARALKVLMFVPYHRFRQAAPGSKSAAQWAECKRRVATMAGADAHILDFMIDSEITRVDSNYWDPLHYSAKVAARLAELIAEGVRTRQGVPDMFAYLDPPGGARD